MAALSIAVSKQLSSKIRLLCYRNKTFANEKIAVGDLLIDTEACSVTRNGVSIQLRRKEYDLLEFLARNSNKFYTSEALIEKLYDLGKDPTSQTIRTHIKNLRRKLDQSGKPSCITNAPGFGYKLAL